MTDPQIRAKRALLAKTALFAVIVLSLCFGGLALWVRSSKLSEDLERAGQDKAALAKEKETLGAQVKEKEQALALAAKQNFQEDLIVVQAALKDVNQKLGEAIRAKASAENISVNLDTRLKNTTSEFTKTLDELKKTRETLTGIDGQYKIKFSQVAENLKAKEEQLAKLSAKLRDKESAIASIQGQGKDYSEATRKYERQVSDLKDHIDDLTKSVAEKERLISQKDDELKRLGKSASKSFRGGGPEEPMGRVSALESEKADLERQVADASARIFDQREQLKDLEKKVGKLTDSIAERDKKLAAKEAEMGRYRREVEAMQKDIQALRSGSADILGSSGVFSEAQAELERRVRALEAEKTDLERRLTQAKKGAASVEGGSKDPFLDRNFRILTETLVKKEEQIRAMQAELDGLLREKKVWEFGSGDRQKRLSELEVLVTTLTKQLGEYASMIDRKDGELKSSAQRIAQLSDEVEAQKVSAIALQRELADARTRQEKTFQTLTQAMGMNAGSSASATSSSPGEKEAFGAGGKQVSDQDNGPATWGPSDSGSYQAMASDETDGVSAQRKVEELRRRVEVLLHSR